MGALSRVAGPRDLDAPRSDGLATAPLAPRVARAAGASAALVFGSVARLRGRRALHPDGCVFAGICTPAGATVAGAFFASRHERAALLRVSRGGGLPETLPDVRGCAIRILDAHGDGRDQDLLLASSLALPVGRHLLIPGRDFGSAFYSSVLPYRVGGRHVLFAAAAEGLASTTLEDVERSVASGRPRIHLLAAPPFGSWTEIATITLDRRAHEADRLRFSPWVTGGGIEPVGLLMELRDPAYRASQAAAPSGGSG